jgi:hypothetical protein
MKYPGKNKGYVVIKQNIHGSAGNRVEVRGERVPSLVPPPPSLSTAGLWTDTYLKTT